MTMKRQARPDINGGGFIPLNPVAHLPPEEQAEALAEAQAETESKSKRKGRCPIPTDIVLKYAPEAPPPPEALTTGIDTPRGKRQPCPKCGRLVVRFTPSNRLGKHKNNDGQWCRPTLADYAKPQNDKPERKPKRTSVRKGMEKAHNARMRAAKGKPSALAVAELLAEYKDEPARIIKGRHCTPKPITQEQADEMLKGLNDSGQKLGMDYATNLRDKGRVLNTVKVDLKHGNFNAWVKVFYPKSKSTAQNLMRVANNWEGLVKVLAKNPDQLAEVSMRALLKMIPPKNKPRKSGADSEASAAERKRRRLERAWESPRLKNLLKKKLDDNCPVLFSGSSTVEQLAEFLKGLYDKPPAVK